MKKIFLFLLIFSSFLLAGCGTADTEKISDDGKIRIAASFYPVAEFAKRVGGDAVFVFNITPAGTEPHDYEPKTGELKNIYNAQLFIYNGAGLDPWAEKIVPDLKKRGIAVLRMADYVLLLESDSESPFDPHFWLDPLRSQKQVEVIRDTMAQIDPVHRDLYFTNAENYSRKLAELDEQFQWELNNCRLKKSIVSHDAFGYLADRYGIDFVAIAGVSPADDPSLKHVGELIEFAKKNQIQYIFFETLANPKLSETIARESGAKTLVLNPLEGLSEKEINDGKNYISVMQENLHNLTLAHECRS